MAEIRGTEEADVLVGKPAESNVILGLGGDDTLTGGTLSDSIDGGLGNDLLLSGGGYGNLLIGGAGSDTLIGWSGDWPDYGAYDSLVGGEGDDRLVGGRYDTLDGGAGDDTFEGGLGSMDIRAGAGDDVINVSPSGCAIDGGAGVDVFQGSGLEYSSIRNVEILEVIGSVRGTAEALEQFDTIRSITPGAMLHIMTGGDADLYDELGDASVVFTASALDDTVIVGNGDDSIDGGYGDWDQQDVIDGRGGNDTIEANGVCTLIGGLGDDVLIGGAGFNSLLGGEGSDDISTSSPDFVINAGAGNDIVRVTPTLELGSIKSGVLDGGAGDDQLVIFGDLTTIDVTGVETLRTSGVTIASAKQLEAFASITGLEAGGLAKLQLSAPAVIDLADELGANRVTITGSKGDDVITAGAGADALRGAEGDDILHGGLGADRLGVGPGYDQLFGEAGADVLAVDRGANSLLDGGVGDDTLAISDDRMVNISEATIVSVEALDTRYGGALATAAQFEAFDDISGSFGRFGGVAQLALADGGTLDLSQELGAGDASVRGSKLDDVIVTGSGDDLIDGSNGADKLDGRAGDDTLLGGSGNDTLIGGQGDNVFDGGGGSDLYIVDGAGVVIREAASNEIDTVRSSISLELSRGVEHLELTGSEDLDGTGNNRANLIFGNRGDNVIDGLAGADTLRGGAGDDVFAFSTAPGRVNVDTILDFDARDDAISLDRDIFERLPKGPLKDSAFKDISTGDVDANDRVLYDANSGSLFYDADGSGASKATLFAQLKGAPSLSADDFVIV